MLRLLLVLFFFLLSLLTVFRAPTNFLWYVSILVTEFSWIFSCIVVAVFFFKFSHPKYFVAANVLCIISFILFIIPIINAYKIAATIRKDLAVHLGPVAILYNEQPPFSFMKLFTGINAKQLPYKTLTYDTSKTLTLDFYTAAKTGKRPCIIVVHGGSWSSGDSKQLPELNSELAKAGYHVASINYRLAPQNIYPAPIEDVHAALTFLRTHSNDLSIDTSNFVLLGRSAGGQIVLSAAYTLNDAAIKGVISYYGPADMVWGYHNPTNPLVLNSRKVMADYLGGNYEKAPRQYVNSSATETLQTHAVPTLLIHGKNDPLVSHLHAERLSSKLKATNVPHYELYLPWATHGFDWTLNGPGGQLSTWVVMRFLETVVATKS
jgi:acetyl esterase/lipase